MSKKQVEAVPEGIVTASRNSPEFYNVHKCLVCEKDGRLYKCGKCKAGRYCSKKCQKEHYPYHQNFCSAIYELQDLEKTKLLGNFSVREESKGDCENKLLNLIGEKPMLKCCLDGRKVEVLWDTGSMISLMDLKWVQKYFPEKKILPVKEFLKSDDLQVRAANSTVIPFEGVVLLEFCLPNDLQAVTVPFLVTDQDINEPILGYNVIEHLVLKNKGRKCDQLRSCLSVHVNKIEQIVDIIEENANASDTLCVVKNPSARIIPSATMCTVKCKVKIPINGVSQSVLYSPMFAENEDEHLCTSAGVYLIKRGETQYVNVEVMNPTNKDIVLKKGEKLGELCSIVAAVPLVVDENENSEENVKVSATNIQKIDENSDISQKFEKEECFSKLDLSHLTEEQKLLVQDLLWEEKDIFSKNDSDIGDIKDFQMKINLSDDVPVREAYRHLPRNLYEEVRNYVNDLLINGWIRESYSAYASPIVCVRKKDNSLRMCLDYRKLNLKTIPDSQPIPRIQDILDNLHGNSWFSTLDMSKAYHQGYIEEKSRSYTAFCTPWALYEWVRIPFGLRNAPPAFQRYVNKCLSDLIHKICEPYLDDILCYGKTFHEHLINLKKVLQRLKSCGVKLRADKCNFLQREVRYLGRLVSEKGYRADPKDTEALEKFREPPKNIGELRSLLGFFGYYRTFVKDFAKIMKPLYDLLKEEGGQKVKSSDKNRKTAKKKGHSYNAKKTICWNSDLQSIVDWMIDYMKSPDMIAYPDFNQPFFMTCDACNDGLGAVLYQRQNGVSRVISYASRTLTNAERNYHLHSGKLEFLALKWAICEKFSDYLKYGPCFTVYTDNNPLTYVLSTAKLNAVGLRWVAELSDFNFITKYRPGKVNVDSDYLSRNALNIDDYIENCSEICKYEDINTVISAVTTNVNPMLNISVEKLCLQKNEDILKVERKDLIEAQKSDACIGPVYQAVSISCRPSKVEWKQLNRGSRLLMHHFPKLVIENGVLLRKTTVSEQIVLPEKYHQIVYAELHENLAHLGPEKVIDLAQQRFYWPYMAKQITQYIQNKCRCVVSKKPNIGEKAQLVPINSTHPFEMIAIDFMHLDKAKGGYEYVMIVSDHFTKFTQAYATKKKSSKAAAEKLFNEFILQYGFPERIHHDRGQEFNSKLFEELHRLTGVKASNTTPYHPMGNGQIERLNRTFRNMLTTLQENEKQSWNKHLSKLAFAYNSTLNKSTGYSPFYLMFGRKSILPIDFIFQREGATTKLKSKSYQKFVDEWSDAMKEAFKIAGENITKSSKYNKHHYDKKVKSILIEKDDRVLVRNVREKGGTGKLKNFWEPNVFVVEEVDSNLPVYKIRNINKKSDKRVVHRNLLKKCNDLPIELFEPEDGKRSKPKPEVKKQVRFQVQNDVDDKDEEDSESDFYIDLHAPELWGSNVEEIDRNDQMIDENIIEMLDDEIEQEEQMEEEDPASPVRNEIEDIVEDVRAEHVEDEDVLIEDGRSEDEEDEDVLIEEDGRSEEESSSNEVSSDESQSNTSSSRPNRNRTRTKFFTYHSFGGEPKYE